MTIKNWRREGTETHEKRTLLDEKKEEEQVEIFSNRITKMEKSLNDKYPYIGFACIINKR